MLVIGVFCAVPCFIAAIVYDFRSPTYEATPSTLEIYFQEAEPAEEGEDVYDFLKSVRIPTKICLDWRKNTSPLGALPIIKQGLVRHPVRNQIRTCREIFAEHGRGRKRADARQEK